MTARIRKLDAHEHDVLADALAATGHPGVAADLFLGDPRSHAFVATEGPDGPAIGVAYGTEILRPEGFWMFVLQRLAVTDDARASGPGRDLLEAVRSFAEAKGLRSMWLSTDAGPEAARRIYPSAGGERSEAGGYWWVFE
jgi:GNAT superfamily N-acetyltransferase